MKIAYFTDVFLPATNGVVTCVKTLSQLLAERGHEILIFTPKAKHGHHVEWHVKNVSIEALPSMPSFFYPDIRLALPFSPAVLKRIKQFDPDVMHAHTPGGVGWTGALLARLQRVPFVATFHTYFMEPEYLSVVGFDKLKLDNTKTVQKLGWSYSNMFYSQAQVVTTPSLFTRTDLIEHGLQQDIRVISNGIDLHHLNELAKETHPLVTKYHLPGKYFLYVGRISKEKSLDILIKTFQHFSKKGTGEHLVIVGDGPSREDLESLVENLDLKDRVHFTGMIEHDTLISSDIFRHAIAFVTASKSEIQPISVLEAMGAGLPVIGPSARGLKDLIKNNGINFTPDSSDELSDALTHITADQKIRDRYAAASTELIKEHDIHTAVTEMEKLYRSLIKKD